MVWGDASNEEGEDWFIVQVAELCWLGGANDKLGAVEKGSDELTDASDPAGSFLDYLIIC